MKNPLNKKKTIEMANSQTIVSAVIEKFVTSELKLKVVKWESL
jgi:hypothetical protein